MLCEQKPTGCQKTNMIKTTISTTTTALPTTASTTVCRGVSGVTASCRKMRWSGARSHIGMGWSSQVGWYFIKYMVMKGPGAAPRLVWTMDREGSTMYCSQTMLAPLTSLSVQTWCRACKACNELRTCLVPEGWSCVVLNIRVQYMFAKYRKGTSFRQAPVFRHLRALR